MINIIAAVIVTYNRRKLLVENLQALQNQSYKQFDVFIVDNASTDGTENAVTGFLSDTIYYVNTGENLGGAGGFKYGIKYALNRKEYKYLWLMDDDTIPERDALQSMVRKAAFLEDNFSYLSSIVKWTDGTACLMNLQIVNKLTAKNIHALSNGLLEVQQASFVSCFLNTAIVHKAGLPISEFFIYGDDVEYTGRLGKIKNGYLDTESIVVHKMASNAVCSLVTCEPDRIERHKYQIRNLVFIAKKNGCKAVMKNILYNFETLTQIIRGSSSHKRKRAEALLSGIVKGIFFNPCIERI